MIEELVFIRPKGRLWSVVDAFSIQIGAATIGGQPIAFTVPAQFETDLATIPWWGRWLFNPGDAQTARAAIVHDALLMARWEERVAGGVFYAELRRDGVRAFRARIMAWAVVFASSSW